MRAASAARGVWPLEAFRFSAHSHKEKQEWTY